MADSYVFTGETGDGGIHAGGGSTNSAVIGQTVFFLPVNDLLLSVSFNGGGDLTIVVAHDLEISIPAIFADDNDLAVALSAVAPSAARVTQFYTEVLRSELNVEDIVDVARVTQFYVEILRSNRGTPRTKNSRKRVIIASGVEDIV